MLDYNRDIGDVGPWYIDDDYLIPAVFNSGCSSRSEFTVGLPDRKTQLFLINTYSSVSLRWYGCGTTDREDAMNRNTAETTTGVQLSELQCDGSSSETHI